MNFYRFFKTWEKFQFSFGAFILKISICSLLAKRYFIKIIIPISLLDSQDNNNNHRNKIKKVLRVDYACRTSKDSNQTFEI